MNEFGSAAVAGVAHAAGHLGACVGIAGLPAGAAGGSARAAELGSDDLSVSVDYCGHDHRQRFSLLG